MKIPVTYALHDERPKAARAVAEKRMTDFVQMFGWVIAHGSSMTLHEFAVSCYMQGCEDMAQAIINEETK